MRGQQIEGVGLFGKPVSRDGLFEDSFPLDSQLETWRFLVDKIKQSVMELLDPTGVSDERKSYLIKEAREFVCFALKVICDARNPRIFFESNQGSDCYHLINAAGLLLMAMTPAEREVEKTRRFDSHNQMRGLVASFQAIAIEIYPLTHLQKSWMNPLHSLRMMLDVPTCTYPVEQGRSTSGVGGLGSRRGSRLDDEEDFGGLGEREGGPGVVDARPMGAVAAAFLAAFQDDGLEEGEEGYGRVLIQPNKGPHGSVEMPKIDSTNGANEAGRVGVVRLMHRMWGLGLGVTLPAVAFLVGTSVALSMAQLMVLAGAGVVLLGVGRWIIGWASARQTGLKVRGAWRTGFAYGLFAAHFIAFSMLGIFPFPFAQTGVGWVLVVASWLLFEAMMTWQVPKLFVMPPVASSGLGVSVGDEGLATLALSPHTGTVSSPKDASRPQG